MRFLFVATLAALCVAAVLAAEAPKPKKSLDKPEKAVSADVPAKGEVKPSSGGDASLTTANSPNPSSNGKGDSPKITCHTDKNGKRRCHKENKTKNEKKTNKGKKDDKKSTTTTQQKL